MPSPSAASATVKRSYKSDSVNIHAAKQQSSYVLCVCGSIIIYKLHVVESHTFSWPDVLMGILLSPQKSRVVAAGMSNHKGVSSIAPRNCIS